MSAPPDPEMRRVASGKGDPVSQILKRKSVDNATKRATSFQAPTDLLTKWKLLQAIIADPSVDACGKLVAVRLLDHCNTKSGRCDPSYKTIADAIGYSRRHVIRAVACLAAAGWIVTKRKVTAGRLASNDFAFAWERAAGEHRAGRAQESPAYSVANSDIAVTDSLKNSPESVTRVPPFSDKDVTISGDVDVTGIVTPTSPKTKNRNHEDSRKGNLLAANDAAPTPAAILFNECRQYLVSTTGISADRARGIVGGWRKNFSDGKIIDAVRRAQRHEAQDPVAFITGCLRERRNLPRTGAMSAIAAIEGVEL
jgi:hypothetical protein